MNMEKKYHDSGGTEKNIWELVKEEPEWAANRIQEGEKAIEKLKEKPESAWEMFRRLESKFDYKICREYIRCYNNVYQNRCAYNGSPVSILDCLIQYDEERAKKIMQDIEKELKE